MNVIVGRSRRASGKPTRGGHHHFSVCAGGVAVLHRVANAVLVVGREVLLAVLGRVLDAVLSVVHEVFFAVLGHVPVVIVTAREVAVLGRSPS